MTAPDESDARTFAHMLREAFAGPEPFDPAPGRAALKAALREFERRDRVLRVLTWGTVLFMTLLAGWAAWSFAHAPADADAKRLLLYAVVFLFATAGIGFGKLWLFTAQSQLALQRDLKRLELTLLQPGSAGDSSA
jgi:hypothetical protein